MDSLSSVYLKKWERICSNLLLGIGLLGLYLIASSGDAPGSEPLSRKATLIGGLIAAIMAFGGLYWQLTVPKIRHRRAAYITTAEAFQQRIASLP